MFNRRTAPIAFAVVSLCFYASVQTYATYAAGRRDALMLDMIDVLHETNQRQTIRIDELVDTVSWLNSKVIQLENADPLPEKAAIAIRNRSE